jgi:hypothetical protein
MLKNLVMTVAFVASMLLGQVQVLADDTYVLTGYGYKSKGVQNVYLTWYPPQALDYVFITRNSEVIASWVQNLGDFNDQTGVRGNNATYTYQVCRQVSPTQCSNFFTVHF